MTFVVLFVLAVIWAVYLASWIRSRTERRSVDSISSFNKHLSVLERTSPGSHNGTPRARSTVVYPNQGMYSGYVPFARRPLGMTRADARRRRRDVLFTLAGAALVTLMLAVVLGGPFVFLQIAADVLLVGYVGLLVHTQRLAAERRTKVRYLPPVGSMGEIDPPYLVPQATANY